MIMFIVFAAIATVSIGVAIADWIYDTNQQAKNRMLAIDAEYKELCKEHAL